MIGDGRKRKNVRGSHGVKSISFAKNIIVAILSCFLAMCKFVLS